jgi:hypothetical protein
MYAATRLANTITKHARVTKIGSPEHAPVLSNLYAGVWWGGFLLVIGLFYSIHFRPSRTK